MFFYLDSVIKTTFNVFSSYLLSYSTPKASPIVGTQYVLTMFHFSVQLPQNPHVLSFYNQLLVTPSISNYIAIIHYNVFFMHFDVLICGLLVDIDGCSGNIWILLQLHLLYKHFASSSIEEHRKISSWIWWLKCQMLGQTCFSSSIIEVLCVDICICWRPWTLVLIVWSWSTLSLWMHACDLK